MTRRRSRRVEKLILPLVAAATVSATLAAPASGDELAAAPRGVPVTSVADGDTITVKISGRAEKVRLIGLDTPEAGECFAKESTRAMTSLVKGKSVRLVSDKSQPNRDRYGRLLRHVVLTDESPRFSSRAATGGSSSTAMTIKAAPPTRARKHGRSRRRRGCGAAAGT